MKIGRGNLASMLTIPIRIRRGLIGLFAAAAMISSVHAADVTWDIDPGAGVTGGAGTWNTTDSKWTTDNGTSNIAWTNANNDTAVFGGTVGTVALGAPITVGGLKFNAGYTLNGSSSNVLTFGTPGNIFTDTGVEATISSTLLTGSTAINKTGAGGLHVLHVNGTTVTYAGAFTLSEGTLRLSGGAYPHSNPILFGGGLFLTGGILHGWQGGYSTSLPNQSVTVAGNTHIRAGSSGTTSSQDRSISLGTLSIGSYTLETSKNTGDGRTQVKFTGTTTLTGNPTFNVGNAPLSLQALNDNGSGRTITKDGAGALTWTTITLSGNHIWNVNTGTLTSGAINTAGFSLTKGGAGALTLGGALTGGGNVVLNGGTLTLGGALTGGGNMVLNGGTLNSGAYTHTAGTLTLSANSTIALTAGGLLAFSGGEGDWSAFTLNLTGPLGTTTGLKFGTDATGLSAAQLARITYNGLASGVAKPVSLNASGYVSCASTDGSWNTDLAGDWTDITKWTGGANYASGADATATFGNVITQNRTITLNTGITIGHISALDSTHNYTISGANILTLDTTTGIPSISVGTAGRTLTISSEIQGSDGLNKIGAGILRLPGANSYSGGTTLTAGTLSFANGSLDTTGNITLAGGTLQWAAGNTQDIGTRLRTSGANALKLDVNGNAVVFGTALDASITQGLTVTATTAGGSLTLTADNDLQSGGLTVGGPGINNSVLNIDGGVTVTNAGAINIGNCGGTSGANNILSLSNGAKLYGGTITLAFASDTNTTKSEDNKFNVGSAAGAASYASIGALTVGSCGSSRGEANRNQLTVRNATLDMAGALVIGQNSAGVASNRADNNKVTVLAGGMINLGANSITIGINTPTRTNGNSLEINGGTVSAGNLTLGTQTSSVSVTNNGLLNIAGNITVGGTGSAMTVGTGGVVTNAGVLSVANANSVVLEAGGQIYATNAVVSAGGVLRVGCDNAQTPSSGRLTVSGNLNITGSTLNLTGKVSGIFVIAKYGSRTAGAFAVTNGLPAEGRIDYSYGGNQIAVVAPPAGTVLIIR